MNRAEERVECCICFEALHSGSVCALLAHDPATCPTPTPTSTSTPAPPARICRHFLHESCARALRAPRRCPLCCRPFNGTLVMPHPVEFPIQWFAFFDTNGDGQLSFDELLAGLLIALPLDPRRIRADSEQLWRRWDRNGDGSIQLQEFLDRREGILAYLLQQYGRGDEQPSPPLIRDSLREWFRFWDEDGSGGLERSEVKRALTKSLRLEGSVDAVAMAATVDAVWFLFDDDGSDSIELAEFLRADGLGETLLASLGRGS